MSWLISKALMEAYENSRCSQVLVEAFSGERSLAGEPSAPSSGSPTPHAYLPSDKMTAFSRLSRFGMMFGPLTDDIGAAVLTWCLADSRARTYRPQEGATALTERGAASGRKWRGSLAKYDPDMRSWRTAQHSLLEDWEEYSETWPRWGMTVDGELYLLPMPALPTEGNESGSWPTPTVCGNHNRKGASPTSGDGLATAVKKWPTPNASDNRDRGNMSDPAIQRRISLGKQIGLLSMAVKEGPDGGSLNPTWVEWLMGWRPGWTDLRPSETDKSPKPQPLPGDC